MAAATQADVFSTIGTTVAISAGLPTTFDAAGYAAKTYTTVGMVDSIGLPSSSYDNEQFDPLDGSGRIKILTWKDSGELTISCADVPAEDGQAILIAHHDGANEREYCSVEITYPSGAIRYYNGMVSDYAPAIDGLNTAEFTVAVSGTGIYVAA
jgi:hypothetical protein